MPQSRPNIGDFTGRQKDDLAKEHLEELKERENEISTANAVKDTQAKQGIWDPENQRLLEGPEAVEVEEVRFQNSPLASAPVLVEVPEEAFTPTVTARVNSDLEQVTFGVNNTYDFEEGKQYRMSRDLYEHLDKLGYIWH